ncbi:hypothetical protein FIBSPDRAFT_854280 [Athelia psychrophila]|uniref:Pentacotripeptide-repeat region of PRORP domain-containing protein n=1 Tax=Athelia psychrophila TaxID=1759441 RepID=A0A166QAL2_9AGAM|nr:hypothetical protein FIBSPDRAFT_854280 [Fibularhizoctonia sp. CBS 109695]
MPYPSVQPDHSIFEDQSPEYNYNICEVTILPPVTSFTPLDTLLKEVQAGRWDSADTLRRELTETGVPIPHHRAFERAAIASLSSPDAFGSWLALVPDIRTHGKHRQLRKIRAALFADPPAHLESIMRFAIIAASKGYAHYVCVQAAASVVRHAPPDVAEQFLFRLAECQVKEQQGGGTRQRVKEMFGVAVRTHAGAGRLEDAVTLLQSIRARGIAVSRFTYTMLMQRLTLAGDEARLAIVQELAPPHVPSILPTPTMTPHFSLDTPTSTLATRLRALRNTMTPRSHPHAINTPISRIPTRELAAFIHDYILHHTPSHPQHAMYSFQHTTAVSLLRRRALGAGNRPAAAFALAEMLVHHQRYEHTEVLRAFSRAFELVGVPAGVRSMLAKDSTQMNPRQFQKLWPTRKHTALVWSALVWLKAREPHGRRLVDELYAELLLQARAAQPQPLPQSSPDAPETALQAPLNPSYLVDEHHFTAFISAFSRERGAPGSARIFADMISLGLKPPEQHWATMLRALAERREAAAVWGVLDAMESDGVVGGPETFPRAGIATHTAVLRGFVKAGLVEEAREAARRIRERYGYVMGGGRERTDRVLKLLERLEEQTEIAARELEERQHEEHY